MPSRGTGSDIALQDAIDLLHKLSAEFTKVVAILEVAPRLRASVFGKVKIAEDDTFWVIDEELTLPPNVTTRNCFRSTIGRAPHIRGQPNNLSAFRTST
jgi:hypothetical protein